VAATGVEVPAGRSISEAAAGDSLFTPGLIAISRCVAPARCGASADERRVGASDEAGGGIRNLYPQHQESIPNFGERYRQGETISTAFVESGEQTLHARLAVRVALVPRAARGSPYKTAAPPSRAIIQNGR
jgi:hypothetical protein